MKKLLLVVLSLSVSGQAIALQQELANLSGALRTLAQKMAPGKITGPDELLLQNFRVRNLDQLNPQEFDRAVRALVNLEKSGGLSAQELAGYRKMINDRENEYQANLENRPVPVPPANGSVKPVAKIPLPPLVVNGQDAPLPAIPAKTAADIALENRLNAPLPPLPHDDKQQLPFSSDGEDEQEPSTKSVIPKSPPLPTADQLKIKIKSTEPDVTLPSVEFVPPVSASPMPEFKQSIKKDVLSLNKQLLSIHDKYLSATIGITPDGNLVVWGPTLKQEKPTPDIFFRDGRIFGYPNADKTLFVMDKGKAKSEYTVYELINLNELKNQKKYFDQIVSQFAQAKGKRAAIENPDAAIGYVASLKNMIAAIVAEFNKSPLLVSSIHTELGTKEVLTAAQAEEFIANLYKFVGELILTVQSDLSKAQDQKVEKLKGTEDKLKASQWNAFIKSDATTKLIQDKIDQLPLVLAALQSIDIEQLKALAQQLRGQNAHKTHRDLDNYYATLQATGQEPSPASLQSPDVSSDDEEDEHLGGMLTPAEEYRLDSLSEQIKKNMEVWKNPMSLTDLEKGQAKALLEEYAVLKKKEDAEWRPHGKMFGLFASFGANY